MLIMSMIAMLAGPAPAQPEPKYFRKVRSDGVPMLCIRHDKRPSIMSSKVQCKTAAGWRVAARNAALPSPTYNAGEFFVPTGYTALGPR